jgi:hypothetical protein
MSPICRSMCFPLISPHLEGGESTAVSGSRGGFRARGRPVRVSARAGPSGQRPRGSPSNTPAGPAASTHGTRARGAPAHAVVDGGDGRQRVQPQGEVKLAAAEVVHDTDGVAARRQVQRGGPAAVAVAACGAGRGRAGLGWRRRVARRGRARAAAAAGEEGIARARGDRHTARGSYDAAGLTAWAARCLPRCWCGVRNCQIRGAVAPQRPAWPILPLSQRHCRRCRLPHPPMIITRVPPPPPPLALAPGAAAALSAVAAAAETFATTLRSTRAATRPAVCKRWVDAHIRLGWPGWAETQHPGGRHGAIVTRAAWRRTQQSSTARRQAHPGDRHSPGDEIGACGRAVVRGRSHIERSQAVQAS